MSVDRANGSAANANAGAGDGGGGANPDGGNGGGGDKPADAGADKIPAPGGDNGSAWGGDTPADAKAGDPKGGEPKKDDPPKPDAKADAPYEVTVPKELAEFADAGALKSFGEWAKEEGFTAEQASKLAAWSAERSKEASAANAEATAKTIADTQAKWLAEVKADKTLNGGDFKITTANVRRAIASMPNPKEFERQVADMGATYWPPFVRLMNAYGALLSNDSGKLPGGGGGGGEETHEQMLSRLYGMG